MEIVIGIVAICCVYFFWNNKKEDSTLLKKIIIEHFESNVSLERAREINRYMNSLDVLKGYLINDVRILTDSMRICLSSKKIDTAFSRFKLANQKFEEMSRSSFLDKETYLYIAEQMNRMRKQFNTVVYINSSKGHVEKSLKMKSKKGKLKYLSLAEDVLRDGLQESNNDKNIINLNLKEVLHQKDILKAS